MSGLAPEFDLLRREWLVQAASDEPVRRTLNVVAPYTGEIIAQVDVAGERHVQDALFAAFSMFRQKDRWLSLERRVSVLERAGQLIESNAELLACEAARESGKPIRGCRREVARLRDYLARAIGCLYSEAGDELPSGAIVGLREQQKSLSFDVPEPLGVAVAVLARNSPLELAARHLFSAVVAGCPIIVKPAEDMPLSCLRLVQILHEAGLPYVWCQSVVTETHEITRQLATDPRVALVSFNGSPEVGWALRSSLPAGTRCLLNHGSVTPALVAPDVDIRQVASTVARDGLMQQTVDGERIQRVFVERSVCDEFVDALSTFATQIVCGDPLSEGTELGSLVREGAQEQVQQYVDQAIAGGARLVCGGKKAGRSGYSPTVLLNPPIDAALSTQSISAPVLGVYPVDSMEDACDRANALPLARCASVFGSQQQLVGQLVRRLDATTIAVNTSLVQRDHEHSGVGLRRSGLGGSDIASLSAAMQISKSLVFPAWMPD